MGTATGVGSAGYPRSALFVQDRSRSWANDPQFEVALKQAVAAIPPAQEMVAIGMSMGGFSALVASSFLPLKAVLSFAPQWSVAPGLMPQERRWSEWRSRLPQIRWPQCPLPEPDGGCHAYVFHAGKDDLAHAERFPKPRNCDHILFEAEHHSDLVPALKTKGVLSGLLDAAFQGDRRRLLRIAQSAGGTRMRSGSTQSVERGAGQA